jgi:hypothetical protein
VPRPSNFNSRIEHCHLWIFHRSLRRKIAAFAIRRRHFVGAAPIEMVLTKPSTRRGLLLNRGLFAAVLRFHLGVGIDLLEDKLALHWFHTLLGAGPRRSRFDTCIADHERPRC